MYFILKDIIFHIRHKILYGIRKYNDEEGFDACLVNNVKHLSRTMNCY